MHGLPLTSVIGWPSSDCKHTERTSRDSLLPVAEDEFGDVLDLSLEWPYSILVDECRALLVNKLTGFWPVARLKTGIPVEAEGCPDPVSSYVRCPAVSYHC